MTKCCVKGCKYKASIDYQTSRWNTVKRIDSFGFCWSHGQYMTNKEIDFAIEDSISMTPKFGSTGKDYKQAAKAKSYSENTLTLLQTHKGDLTVSNYQELIGKRFRMTKDQKDRKLTRNEALNDFLDSL